MLFLTGKKLMVRSCNNSVSHLNVDIYLRHEHKLLDIKRSMNHPLIMYNIDQCRLLQIKTQQ